jgi:hypothetical protein
MPRIDVYDPPMCCSTGVCGPDVDPALPRFAGDLAWLGQGPGSDALPVVLVDGALASQGRYPTRDELAAWTGLAYAAADKIAPSSLSLPTASCCGPDDGAKGSGCCG